MTLGAFLIPILFSILLFFIYKIRDFLQSLFFVSLTIEELGSFTKTIINVISPNIYNINYAIGSHSVFKSSVKEDTFYLNPGFYFGFYKRKFILLRIQDWNPQASSEVRHPIISLMFFRWNKKILLNLLDEIIKEDAPVDYYVSHYNWISIARKRYGFEGLFFDKNLKEEIIKLVSWFVSKEGSEWYHFMRQSYKLVLLFHGPPGSGKTALAKAIADITNRSLVTMKLSSIRKDVDIGTSVISNLSHFSNSVILFDEIDKLFIEETDGSKIDPTTLLGILNGDFLNGQILIITANELERIPESFRESMLRHRRIDVKYEIDAPTSEQLEAVCSYHNLCYTDLVGNSASMAEVVEKIMLIKNNINKG